MNKLLIEFMKENELDEKLNFKKAAEKQMAFVRDKIGMHLTHSPIFVLSTHMSKSCLLPVYGLKLTNGIEIIMRENFYGWVISIRSPFIIEKLPKFCYGDYLCKSDYSADIATCYCEGFNDSWVYKFKNENFNYSTFRVYEDYDLYTLIYLLNNLNGETVKDETSSPNIIKTCIEQTLKNHPSCERIYDVFPHSFFKASDYDFCEKNNIEKMWLDSEVNEEEDIMMFATRVSQFEELRVLFFDELHKIIWGENFK